MTYYAVGSSYLMRQVAGSERIGGLEIKVRHRQGERGTIETKLTDWRDRELPSALESWVTDAVIEGIKEFAHEQDGDINDLDITLQRFLWHELDASARVFRKAGYCAFRSAIEMLIIGR